MAKPTQPTKKETTQQPDWKERDKKLHYLFPVPYVPVEGGNVLDPDLVIVSFEQVVEAFEKLRQREAEAYERGKRDRFLTNLEGDRFLEHAKQEAAKRAYIEAIEHISEAIKQLPRYFLDPAYNGSSRGFEEREILAILASYQEGK